MNFHSLTFGFFFAAVLFLYWLAAGRRNLRIALLLVASYYFYGSWEVWYLGLIVFSTLLDYHCGQAIFGARTQGQKRFWLGVSLVGNLGVLIFFKYYDWGVGSLDGLLRSFGLSIPLRALEIMVPVGISFYTFQTLSYTLDIYRGFLKPARNLLDFAFFVAFFPQLVAGPIVRAKSFLPQLDRAPPMDRERFLDGLWRVGTGLVKKVALADTIGRLLVDPVYSSPELFTGPTHLLAFFAFTFQIYYDFSGYSDIAIGLARLLGFDLPENFNRPFQSRSVSEFWRRWHMTLAFWVRDYLFASLMGRRAQRSELRIAIVLFITMLVIGVWHGAGFLWVIYGTSQGLVVLFERFLSLRRQRKPFATTRGKHLIAWFLTFTFIVLVSGMCVRSQHVGHLKRMLTEFGEESSLPTWGLVALGVGALLHFLPQRLTAVTREKLLGLPVGVAGLLFGLTVGLVSMLVVGEAPFIYFQF